jgi:hypothetical protein
MQARLTVLAAAVAGALLVAPAQAGGECTVLSDPAGDVLLLGDPATAGAATADGHLDVTTVDLSVSPGRVVATIHLTGLVEGRLGEWRLGFAAGREQLVMGAGLGMWVNAGDYHGISGFVAGRSGHRGQRVTGAIDYAASTVTISAPATAFAPAAVAPGMPLSGFTVQTREVYANLPAAGPAPQSVWAGDVASTAAAVRATTC